MAGRRRPQPRVSPACPQLDKLQLINPDLYTFWNYRKEILAAMLVGLGDAKRQEVVLAELALNAKVITERDPVPAPAASPLPRVIRPTRGTNWVGLAKQQRQHILSSTRHISMFQTSSMRICELFFLDGFPEHFLSQF